MSSRNVRHKTIVFVVPYPFDLAPGQRFRYEQYLNILKEHGYKIHIRPFLSESTYALLYGPGKKLQKLWGTFAGLIRRFASLPGIVTADFVFIFREASPVGPPFFEWIISRLMRKKIIYDFDDAIWMTDKLAETLPVRLLRWRSKVSSICKWSYKVSCGNEYLCSYARQFNKQTVLNPTTIDTELLHNPGLYKKEASTSKVTIGWTGSHSTLKYLTQIEDVLLKLVQEFSNIQFVVIANQKPALKLQNLIFMEWSKKTEALDLLKIDIGIMPLPTDEWTKGKCGFKALQYMAMEIPTVASPVGVNTRIITHNENGFLAETEEEWLQYLRQLITEPDLRKKLGAAGRKTVVDRYSVSSNTSNFLSLFT